MLRVTSDRVVYAMSAKNVPEAAAESGDTVCFETLDCFACQVRREDQDFGCVDWSKTNPATGPLFINGAKAGDTLKVEILSIELDSQAVVMEFPGDGVTGIDAEKETAKILPITKEGVMFSEDLVLPIKPMIGVIGTAPAEGEVRTDTPGKHGGNLDCTAIGEGTVLYLPVNVDGALLAMGDLHAVMGDGEVCVCGAEISGAVTVRVTVLKESSLPLPFIVTDEYCAALASADSLDEAAKSAAMNMRDMLVDLGMKPNEAGMLLSLAGDLCICQVVNPKKTCRMQLPVSVAEKLGWQKP